MIGALAAHGLALMTSGAAPETDTPSPTLRWVAEGDPREAYVDVAGWDAGAPEKWETVLTVHVVHEDLHTALRTPPMLGSYQTSKGGVRFIPQFGLQPGLRYRATLKTEGKPLVVRFDVPRERTTPTTVVSHIYPSSNVLPENLLKFYLHFSASMSRGDVYDHIHLTDAEGNEVELPFLEIDEELWSPEMRRLTLFIDPGRIKRGVKPLEDLGPSLQAGSEYTLTIDANWLDAEGLPLKEAYQKTFRVGSPDRDPPNPTQWVIAPPKANTRDPLTITFPEPMEAALAKRLIQVAHVVGDVRLHDDERRWVLEPKDPWSPGEYKVMVPAIIEDLAGNNIGKRFEVDIFEKIDDPTTKPTVVSIPFRIGD